MTTVDELAAVVSLYFSALCTYFVFCLLFRGAAEKESGAPTGERETKSHFRFTEY